MMIEKEKKGNLKMHTTEYRKYCYDWNPFEINQILVLNSS